MSFLRNSDEQNLARRLRHGDDVAMREFYAQYVPYLKGVCSRYIVDREDAKDVLQDALISIVTHISDFRYQGKGSLKSWAARIVSNEALKFLRDTKQHELAMLEMEAVAVTEEVDPPIEDIPPEAIQEMVRRLPTGYRTVFNLYVFEDKSHEEIARLLGIKVNTSTSQFFRAKQILAKMIKAYHNKKQ